ncbi:MAG: FAD-dependent thymidylate synthase [Clostridia bacterium]|nr:FAD-dependent thymidylate synthase [Clostridia bacterium]
MKLKLLAYTTQPGYEDSKDLQEFRKLTKHELGIVKKSVGLGKDSERYDHYKALLFCSKMAGICYMEDDFEHILNESAETSFRRLRQVITSGHHSVFDHVKLTFELSGIPKVLAMFLNNEKDYATSEKSARYTKPEKLTGDQKRIYFEWFETLIPIIRSKYPTLYDESLKKPNAKIKKLAQENARYFISIFEPITTMGYTTSLRQWNYLIYMCEKFIECSDPRDGFSIRAVPYMKEFVKLAKRFQIKGLVPLGRNRNLSLIGDPAYFDLPDMFSYSYQTSFYASYACFAQVQRHRSESCFIYNTEDVGFYVPEIIRSNEQLTAKWLQDAKKVMHLYPQGKLIKIVQTGNIDTFIMKYCERCCGSAQLETMRNEVDIANKFVKLSPYGYKILEETHGHTAKCQFEHGFCARKCMLGSNQYDRVI